MDRDPYKLLGIGRDATLKEVRAAYRKAALQCHPDTFDGEVAEAERLFRELTAAYKAILRNLGLRRGHQRKAMTPAELAALELAKSLVSIRAAFHRARGRRQGEAHGGRRRDGDRVSRDLGEAYQSILRRIFRSEGASRRKGPPIFLPKHPPGGNP